MRFKFSASAVSTPPTIPDPSEPSGVQLNHGGAGDGVRERDRKAQGSVREGPSVGASADRCKDEGIGVKLEAHGAAAGQAALDEELDAAPNVTPAVAETKPFWTLSAAIAYVSARAGVKTSGAIAAPTSNADLTVRGRLPNPFTTSPCPPRIGKRGPGSGAPAHFMNLFFACLGWNTCVILT